MKNFSNENLENAPKVEQAPKYRLMVSRHAERLPDGSLAPEGVEASIKKGKLLSESAEVIKGYASDEKTKRTVVTSDFISESSETTSPFTGKKYKTARRKDIQYDVLSPDLIFLLKEGKKINDDATIKELGLPEGTVLENLPKEEQEKIAPVRQRNQVHGFRYLLGNSDGIHRMSMGMANQLAREFKLIDRYDEMRKKEKPLEKDVILNTVTHGMFSESLFLEAGYIKTQEGKLRKINKDDLESSNFGGFIDPSESFFMDVADPKNIPDMIPVSFEKQGRPGEGVVFMDKNKILELAEEYKKWKSKIDKK